MIKPFFPDTATYSGAKTRNKEKSCLTCRRFGYIIRKNWLFVCAEYLPNEKTALHSIAKQEGEPYEENKQ